MKRLFASLIVAVILSIQISCNHTIKPAETSSINLFLFIGNYHQLNEVQQSYDIRLKKVIVFFISDLTDTLKDTVSLQNNQTNASIQLTQLPSGPRKTIQAWTMSDKNILVHSGSASIAQLQPGQTQTVTLQLFPRYGSIYIPISNIPKHVDSLFGIFLSKTDTIENKIKHTNNNETLIIDYIPDKMSGKLIVFAVDSLHDTLLTASKEFIFDATKNTTITLTFNKTSPSSITMSLHIISPGITVAPFNMNKIDTVPQESGPLIISEIMYYAGDDSDYVELYNPTNKTVSYDSLIVQVIGGSSATNTSIIIPKVTIQPNGFFVIGNGNAPDSWVNCNIPMKIASSEKWILLRSQNHEIIDWVSYNEGKADWPHKKSHCAILLDSLNTIAEYNNYGKHWKIATQQIEGTNYYGTPGKL